MAWILALPIIDSFGLLVTRLKEKRPAFSADRRHFHHHFLSAGFNPGQTSVIIIGYSFLLGAIGFFGIKIGVPEYILGWLWIVLWIGHTVLTIRSDCLVRKLERLNQSIQR